MHITADRQGRMWKENDAQDRLLEWMYTHKFGRLLLKILVNPHISEIGGKFLESGISRIMIRPFIKRHSIEMDLYEDEHYRSYNDFFKRRLKAGARIIEREPEIFISPCDIESIVANKEISERFNIVSPEILLIPNDMKINTEKELLNEIKNVDGIDMVLSTNNLSEYGLTNDMLPSKLQSTLESENYRLVLINSVYEVASDELNVQIKEVNDIIDKYDKDIILAGEGALMNDLVSISDNDFKNVNTLSIVLVLIVMLLVLKSISLPILLVTTILFAIFVNMGISYFGGSVLPFVAPIVLGTIQLGATIDYAILLTTNYLKNRKSMNKENAIKDALNYSNPSIFVSGLCFFAATFGVGVYSELEMVGSLCTLISRGAIISMLVVVFVLPSVLLIFDKLISKTTIKEKEGNENE